MKFIVEEPEVFYDFTPFYSKNGQSFFYQPDAPSVFSIIIGNGYISLDVSLISSTFYCISGYSPQSAWIKFDLNLPKAIRKNIKVISDCELHPGTGIDYGTDWKTFYNVDNDVICIGVPQLSEKAVNIEFNTNTIASIIGSDLVAIWIKPDIVN